MEDDDHGSYQHRPRQGPVELARKLTGATSNREVVEYALELLIAQKRQVEIVERIIARGPGDVDAPVIHYDVEL